MKAVICTNYGSPDVLQMMDVEKPIPKNNEVLIKIHATTVTSGDWRIRSATFPKGFWLIGRLAMGFSKPRKPILGFEFAGKIEKIGVNVNSFKTDDQVFGISGSNMGANAEYMCVRENSAIALKPDSISFEQAAVIPFGGTTALYYLRDKGNIKQGQKVLINGASGSVGTAGIQIAKYFGAEVTAVCSTVNIDLVKKLGADKVIDYTKTDFTKNGKSYDLVLDTVGNVTFLTCKDSLKPKGKMLAVVAGIPDFIQMVKTSIVGSKKVIGGVAAERQEDIIFLKELLEAGKLKPVIDSSYPLEKIADAHTLVGKGHKKGNVVITVNNP